MHLRGARYSLFLRVYLGVPLRRSADDDRTPPSLPASIKEILKEEHSGKAYGEVEALGKDHNPSGRFIRHATSQLRSARGLLWRTSIRGTHAGPQDDHPDRRWAGPTAPGGVHPDYLHIQKLLAE